jgi:nucleoid-associated protein YgaU
MALGFGEKKSNRSKSSDDNGSPASREPGEKDSAYDAEGQTTGGRKMSRIDGPITNSISGNAEGGRRLSADGADVSVGQQLEMEAGNAIQYRTCSWQKV